MAWRNQGITGSNNIPLGSRRRGFDEQEEDDSRTATPSSVPDGPKRGRSPVRGMFSPQVFHKCLFLTLVLLE